MEEMHLLLIGRKKKIVKERKKKKHYTLNSIKTVIMALVVRPEDSFVSWLC